MDDNRKSWAGPSADEIEAQEKRATLNPMIGPGGAPTRNTTLPTDAAGRKEYPMATGLLDYFPDALACIANVSFRGNQQHNPGQPLNWARGKSTDEADTMIRHLTQRGTIDVDGVRHSAKVAWRALALLQKEIEGEQRSEQFQEEHQGSYMKPGYSAGDCLKSWHERQTELAESAVKNPGTSTFDLRRNKGEQR